MASPQKENGYTAIANELLEQIVRLQLNGTQFRIIMTVWRYTYGFNRKSHSLSEAFIARATNIHKMQIARELRVLINKKVFLLIREATFNSPKEIAFNKNYDEWVGLQSADTLPVNDSDYPTVNELAYPTVSESVYPTVSESAYQERNNKDNIKDNIKNNTYGDFQSPPEPDKPKIAKKELDDFFESIWALYPKKQGKGSVSETKKKKLFKTGFDEIQRCIERYKQYLKENCVEERFIKQGSTFFNSGYVDYLDENYIEPLPGATPANKYKVDSS